MKKLMPLIIFTLVLCCARPSFASETHTSNVKQVVLIVADNIGVQDFADTDLPNIKRSLSRNAAIGLMNTRSAQGAGDRAGAFLSIGAGSRASGGGFGRLAFNRNETASFDGVEQVFAFPNPGFITTPGYPDIWRANSKLNYPVFPGALGETLRQAHIKRSALGNADALGRQRREINLITMDAQGATDFGNVAVPMQDPAQSLSAIDRELKRSRFVALEYSPSGTIDNNRFFLSDDDIKNARYAALRDVDRIFGGLLKRDDAKNTMIILLSPEAPINAASANRFRTPVVIAAPGYRGLLTSGSTRWQGLVANTDIAPTMLEWLGLPVPALLPGRAVVANEHADPMSTLLKMEQQVLANYTARSILLSPFITLAIALMSAAGVLLLFLRGNKNLSYLQPILLALLFMPCVSLASNIPILQIPWLVAILVPVASLILGFITWFIWRSKPNWAVAVPGIMSLSIILVQLPFGSILERDSVLGMSSIIGARFYGIGNEYVGVLLGAAAIVVTTFLAAISITDNLRSWLAAVFFIGLTVMVGLPMLGANVGGTLATVATGSIIFLALRGIKLRTRHLIFVSSGMILAIAGILIADYFTNSFSHAFRTASMVENGNLAQIGVVITRKLGKNIHLVSHTSWTNILIAAAATATILRFGARELWDKVSGGNRILAAGWKTICFSSVAALVFNDSGVVTAAFMVLFAVYSWLYLMIDASVAAQPGAPTFAGRTTELLSH